MEKQMNIKRAFLVLAAALLMPGLAMAGTTAFATFNVTLDFDKGNNWDSSFMHIDCDGGLPLSNDSATGLEDGDDVDFILEFPEAGEGTTNCYIWADAVAGYTPHYTVSGDSSPNWDWNSPSNDPVDEPWGCYYTLVGDQDQNSCDVQMLPDDSYLRVYKTWDSAGSPGELLDYTAKIGVCTNRPGVIEDDTHVDPLDKWCVWRTVTGPLDDYLDVTFDGASHGGDQVYIYEYTFDSTIEVDIFDCVSSPTSIGNKGGIGGLSYKVVNGDGTGPGLGANNCTIENTIFFEGIPTLNQYGLAIMALLMLGVGFVGFRRFV
jgi:hypothetical protein